MLPQLLPTWPASRAPPASTPNTTCAASSPGAPSAAWTRWPRGGHTWSCPSGGCKKIRRFKPSTVSRRFSAAAGFYRTCVLDSLLEHSPAEHVRRPSVPAGSPTLGFTHPQFEALLTAARESPSPCDFALVAMLGLLGLRSSKPPAQTSPTSARSTATGSCASAAKGTKIVLVPLPPAVGRAIDRAVASRDRGPILLNTRGARMDRHAATRRLHRLAEASGIQIARAHPHMLRHTYVTTMLDARPPPELSPGRLHGVRHLTRPTPPVARAAGGVRNCRIEHVVGTHAYALNCILVPALIHGP